MFANMYTTIEFYQLNREILPVTPPWSSRQGARAYKVQFYACVGLTLVLIYHLVPNLVLKSGFQRRLFTSYAIETENMQNPEPTAP